MSDYSRRLMQIKQCWLDFNQFSNTEKLERSKDIQSLLDALSVKVKNHEQFQSAKSQAIDEELDNLSAQIQSIRKLGHSMSLNQENVIENCKQENQQHCLLIHNQVQNHIRQISNTIQNQFKFVKQSVEEECKTHTNIITKNKNEIKQTKQFVEKRLRHCKQSQIQSLNQLCMKVNQQMGQVHQFLAEKRLNKLKKQEKLKCMTDNLISELGKQVQKQRKMGKMTYQCVLNLIQDFHNHISSKSSLF